MPKFRCQSKPNSLPEWGGHLITPLAAVVTLTAAAAVVAAAIAAEAIAVAAATEQDQQDDDPDAVVVAHTVIIHNDNLQVFLSGFEPLIPWYEPAKKMCGSRI